MQVSQFMFYYTVGVAQIGLTRVLGLVGTTGNPLRKMSYLMISKFDISLIYDIPYITQVQLLF